MPLISRNWNTLAEITKNEEKMKKRIMKVIGGLTLTVMALAAFAQVLVSAQVDTGQGLVGSWDVVVTPRDCATEIQYHFLQRFMECKPIIKAAQW
jgi:hypothetical protein